VGELPQHGYFPLAISQKYPCRFCGYTWSSSHQALGLKWLGESTHVRLCVSKSQKRRVLDYIKIRQEEQGVEIAAQGTLLSEHACKDGFFVLPAWFKGVTREMIIAQEQNFGPVVTVSKFESEEKAIAIAKSSHYGLTSRFYIRDVERSSRVPRKFDTRITFNNHYFSSAVSTPF
jgi:acyl-CoA reductase-like NAD-dependent aldehyde dehydrogenase